MYFLRCPINDSLQSHWQTERHQLQYPPWQWRWSKDNLGRSGPRDSRRDLECPAAYFAQGTG